MSFTKFWRRWCAQVGSQRIRRVRQRRATRPEWMAHVLEERILLSTITVTSLADNVTADGQVTLREALAAANTNASVDGSTAGESGAGGGVQDTIVFQVGLTGTIALDGGLPALQISDSVKIVGWGATSTVIDAQQNYRVFDVTNAAGNVQLEGLTVTGGRTTAVDARGGGIQFLSTGTLTLIESNVSGNTTAGNFAFGGGIYTNVGPVVVQGSLLSGNSTGGRGGDGAAIFSRNAPLTLINSTVSGNFTGGYHADAAIYTIGGLATISLVNSTVTNNFGVGTEADGGGGIVIIRAPVSIVNSIVSGNHLRNGNDFDIGISGYANPATFTASHSLIGVNTNNPLLSTPVGIPDANGNLVGSPTFPVDALLGPLADNGGPTKTHALFAGSPAIDAGVNPLALDRNGSPLSTDQRSISFARIDHGTVDMGSFEGMFGSYPSLVANPTLIVTTASDELDSDLSDLSDLSLREAIALADAQFGPDVITFAPGLSDVPIELTLGQLSVSGDLQIVGLGAQHTVIDAQQNSRAIDVAFGGTDLTLEGLAITGGKTTANSDVGGGIRLRWSGSLTLSNTVVAGNSTTGRDAFGGGIYSSVASIVLRGSLISGNSTTGRGSDGAAIFSQNAPMTLINSTVSGNFTAGYHATDAIYTVGPLASLTLVDTTLTNNYGVGTEEGGGGGIAMLRASTTIINSIVSGNRLRDGRAHDITIELLPTPIPLLAFNSIIGVNAGTPLAPAPVGSPDANGNLVGTVDNPIDALLGPLADNGGPIKTHALFAGSPAIDAGDNALAVDPITLAPLTTDQRGSGFPRIDHGTVDMGSFEGSFPDYPPLVPNATLVVTTASDELDADLSDLGDLSLREAIAIANAQFGPDIITFAPGLSDFPIQLTLGQLTVTDDLQVIGLGAQHTVIDALGTSRVIDVPFSGVDLALDGVTITGGLTTANFESGGGIRMRWAGSLTLTNSAVSGNATTGRESFGGGIYSKSAAVTLHGSLLSGNATWGRASDGAAVFSRNAPLTFVNSTVSGNFTAGYHADAAIYTIGGLASVHLVNSTITNNYGVGTEEQGGGGVVVIRAPVTIVNSIVSGNHLRNGDDYDVGISGYANPATFTATHSLIGVNTGNPLSEAPLGSPDGNGNLIGTPANPIDARLAPLADNGGPTKSHVPLPDSPAIDGGDNALAVDPFTLAPLTTDQRGAGFQRIDGGLVDMGAVEVSILVVTTAQDELDPNYAPDDLSLREALVIANARPGHQTIVFADVLAFTPIMLSLGQLTIGDSVTIAGLGAARTIIDAQHGSRVFEISQGAGDVTFRDLTVTGGSTSDIGESGGGIRFLSTGSLNVVNSVVTGNATFGDFSRGGGIYSETGAVRLTNSILTDNSTDGYYSSGGGFYSYSGSLTLTGSTVSDNSTQGAYSKGGGLGSFEGEITLSSSEVSGNSTEGSYAVGGGIFDQHGAVTLTASTVSGNATYGYVSGGGGIYSANGDVALTNSTLSGNTTGGDYAQGAGLLAAYGDVTIIHCTIAENHAYGYGTTGSGVTVFGGSATVVSSIVAANSASMGPGADFQFSDGLQTATFSASFSLFGTNDGLPLGAAPVGSPDADGNLVGTPSDPIDPLLVPLADNGGPTQTMALLPGSPAINAGGPTALPTDQRGMLFARVDGNASDIGAYEAQSLHLVVTTGHDELDVLYRADDLSLREALDLANRNPGFDSITFAPALAGQSIKLTLGQLTITDTVAVVGLGSAFTIIDAQQASRVFDVTSTAGDVTFDGLTITGGRTTGALECGGGVRFLSSGTLAIVNSTISGNSTTGDIAYGGGVHSDSGAVSFTGSILSDNSTTGFSSYGGGIHTFNGALTFDNSLILDNSTAGVFGHGGGLYSGHGSVVMTNSSVSGNSATGFRAAGGGIYIWTGDLTLTNSVVSGNSTEGDEAYGGGVQSYSGSMTLTGTTVSNNSTMGERARGGGVNKHSGVLAIIDSTISGNSTAGSYAYGGGVATYSSELTLTNTTVSGNSTTGTMGIGGGILSGTGGATLTNCTVSGNSTTGDQAYGGGLYSVRGELTVTNSIIAGNSVLAGESRDILFISRSPDVSFSASFSLFGTNDGIPLGATPVGSPDAEGNLVGTPSNPIDPLLAPLADNGGPTQTMALLPSSPALNAGGPTTLLTDQRGQPRVAGTAPDMGAFELPSVLTFTSTATPRVRENTTAVLTVHATDVVLPGQVATYALTGGVDQSRFTITASGELKFVTPPDFENPADDNADNVYLIQVTASDLDGHTAVQDLSVTVIDASSVFYTDFESGLPSEISGAGSVATSQGYRTGQFFQNDTVSPIQATTLTLTNLPAHTSIDLSFLLGIINSWDGLDRSPTVSPDYFNVTIDGVSLFHETFSNFDTESQTYVPPDGVLLTPRIGSIGGTFTDVFADLGFGGESFWGDALYAMGKDPHFDNIPHSASTLTISWFASGAGYQGGINESWALDNIEVILNNAPIFTSTAAPAVPENTTSVLTVTATDAGIPPQPVTYSITGGADQSKFSITPEGVLSFVNAPDYENPTDANADNVYLVQVTASDGGEESAVQYLSVTVTPVNDNNPVFTSTASFTVPESSTVVSTITATDADLPAQTISYSITGGSDQSKFSITPAGVLSFVTPPVHASPADANTDNVYLVQVTASDGAGRTTIQNLAVTVTDSTLAFFTDFESGLPAQITGGGSVVSSQGYGTGDFLQNTTVNPVVPTTLTLTNLPAHTSIDLNFLLAIINTWDGLDRSPTASPDYFNVTIDGVSLFHETFSNFDTQSQTYVPPDGVLLTPRIGPIPGDRFFDVFPNLGFGGLPSSGEALYSMGKDPRFDNIPHTASTLTISWFASGAGYQGGENESWALDNVEVILHKNHDPVLISTETPTVPENTTTVLTVTATDSDLPAQTITYSITGGADQGRFTITPAGVLSFVSAPDYESPTDANADNVYLVQVTASDGAGGTAIQNLSVTIGDVVETTFATFTRPRYVPTPLTFAELKAGTTVNIPSGHTLGLRVDAVTTGSLQITHLGVTTTAAPGTVVVDGDTLTWTSAQGATGLTEALRLSGVDLSNNQRVLADIQVRINLVNVAPFLSEVNTFDGGLQQTPYNITYEMLQAAANESDANSDVLGFRIRSIQNGSLTITKSGTNTAFPIVVAQTLVLPGDILTWTGGVTQTGNSLPIFAVRAWDGLAGSGVDIQVSLNVTPFGTLFDLSGPWSVGGKLANINQSGSNLVLTDQNGQVTAGAYTGLTTITGRFGLTGVVDTSTPDNGRIVWSDGVVWLKLSVGGQYYVSNPNLPNIPPALVKVVQSGGALTFFNRVGDSAAATFVSPTIVSIPKWKLTAIYADGALKISNGLTWYKLDLSPSYTESVSGLATEVIQRTNSVELTFVDTAGATSSGFWQSPTQVKAADWNSIGTVINGQILWSGGTVDGQIWNKHLVLFGSGSGAGPGFVKIEATNNQILLTNKLGTVMQARLIDAYTLYNVDTGKYFTRKNGKLDFGGGLIWSDFDFNALDAVFSDIKTFPFGI